MKLETGSEMVFQAVIEAFTDPVMRDHNISLKETVLVAEKLDRLIKINGFIINKTEERDLHDQRDRLQLQLEQ